VTSALSVPGGLPLVIDMLARIPGARVVTVRQGWTGKHTSVEVGNYRFAPTKDGRLEVGHAVNDVVLSTQALHAGPAASAIVQAAQQQVINFGPGVIPDIEAITAGLEAAGR